jgi:hypothetical protein
LTLGIETASYIGAMKRNLNLLLALLALLRFASETAG